METHKIWFDKGMIYLKTDTDKTGSLPLKAFPGLYNATDEQRMQYTISPMGVHWNELDEDLSFEGFFAVPDEQTNRIAQMFASLPEINVTQFARITGINQSLMAKYICGAATPSQARIDQIVNALHRLGHELCSVKL